MSAIKSDHLILLIFSHGSLLYLEMWALNKNTVNNYDKHIIISCSIVVLLVACPMTSISQLAANNSIIIIVLVILL